MPRRPRPLNDTLEDRWNGSKTVALQGSWEILQVAGLESPSRTLFVRRLVQELVPSETSPSIAQVVEQVLHESKLSAVLDCDTLRELGAIWLLDSTAVDRPQNRPTWHRLSTMDGPFHCHMILRIHSRPPRFAPRDSTWNIANAIVHSDDMRGFVIVNKADGLPSHGTVDNAVENILFYFQTFYRSTSAPSGPATHISLPHRLDTETSGLLLIATHKRFATYASQLLEHGSVTKQYRCLLVCPSLEHWQQLVHLHQSLAIVTHFLDSKSSAPKRFATQIPLDHDSHKNSTWLECRLRLQAVGELQMWHDGSSVAEVQVELLTGRTHQIRGQVAALGCPIVGDPLYGTTWETSGTDKGTGHDFFFPRFRGSKEECHAFDATATPRMALQCCRLALALPDPITFQPLPDQQQLIVELDQAWWSEQLLSLSNSDQGRKKNE